MSQIPAVRPAALPRSLGTAGALFLTLSATTPASSVFVILPDMLHGVGTGAMWAMLIAALVCVATAYVYAELASAWPQAGGEYVMVAHTLGPLAGFVMLGINLVNNLLFPAVIGLGLSDVLSAIVPGLRPIPVAVLLIAGCTALGLLQIRVNAWVTGLFLAVELAALLLVAGLGFLHPHRSLLPFLLAPVHATASGFAPADLAAIGLASTVAIFALNGYGVAVYFGEDIAEAPKRVARVILLALVLTLGVEIVPLAAALAGAPDLRSFLVARDPFGRYVSQAAGEAIGGWLSLAVAVAIANAAIASVLAYARFFYSTGRDRVWGARVDALITAVHPRLGSPWIATLAVGGIGIAACFVPLQLLVVLSGAGLVVIYLGLCVAVLVGRRTGATNHACYRMPLFPLAPAVTIAALIAVLWSSWQDVASGRPGLIATAVQMLVAALYYLLVLKRRGGWVLQDPAA